MPARGGRLMLKSRAWSQVCTVPVFDPSSPLMHTPRADQGFLELVDSAKAFMSMPTRLSGSLPGSTTHTAPEVEHHHHPTSSTLFTSALGTLSPVPRPPLNWHHPAPSSPSSSFPSSDPFLPSSVPDLSSGPDELSSPGVKGQAKGGKGSSSTPSEKATAQGWFAWLGKTVEIKVWHLVGLCGLLVGVGVGIGAR